MATAKYWHKTTALGSVLMVEREGQRDGASSQTCTYSAAVVLIRKRPRRAIALWLRRRLKIQAVALGGPDFRARAFLCAQICDERRRQLGFPALLSQGADKRTVRQVRADRQMAFLQGMCSPRIAR
jgi:hypothetical protein